MNSRCRVGGSGNVTSRAGLQQGKTPVFTTQIDMNWGGYAQINHRYGSETVDADRARIGRRHDSANRDRHAFGYDI